MYTNNNNRALDNVLELLSSVTPNGKGYKALCPAHEDGEPSLSVNEGDDGRVLLYCFAGCDTERVVEAVGLSISDLFPMPTLRIPSHELQGWTLEEYAAAKGLPVTFLRDLGLSDRRYQGKPAIRIPYRGTNGEEVAVRYRLALEKSERADDRFKWKTGSKTVLYGLERLEKVSPNNSRR